MKKIKKTKNKKKKKVVEIVTKSEQKTITNKEALNQTFKPFVPLFL